MPAWTYDFTSMSNGAAPAGFVMSDGVGAQILGGAFVSAWTDGFTRHYSTDAAPSASTTLYVIEAEFLNSSGQFRCYWGSSSGIWGPPMNAAQLLPDGSLNGENSGGGDGGSTNIGAFSYGVPFQFAIEYNNVSGVATFKLDGSTVYAPTYSMKATGNVGGLLIDGNVRCRLFRWYYGNLADGYPGGAAGPVIRHQPARRTYSLQGR